MLRASCPAQSEKQHSTPVLVELFTSEGCSDCPPADGLLARVADPQVFPGTHVIVLSEHVTYWNHLGWSDPFSLEEMDRRQVAYQEHFRLNSVYTPQMVVDGIAQFVGSNGNALQDAIEKESSIPKHSLQIDAVQRLDRTVRFSVHTEFVPGSQLYAAVAANATRSEVRRGENAGRTLHHVAVVRSLKQFDAAAGDGRPLSLNAPEPAKGDASEGLKLVVFLANKKDGHILAVAEQSVER